MMRGEGQPTGFITRHIHLVTAAHRLNYEGGRGGSRSTNWVHIWPTLFYEWPTLIISINKILEFFQIFMSFYNFLAIFNSIIVVLSNVEQLSKKYWGGELPLMGASLLHGCHGECHSQIGLPSSYWYSTQASCFVVCFETFVTIVIFQ